MFHVYRKSMAVCVMAFILLCGCQPGGRTVEPVRTDSEREDIWRTGSESPEDERARASLDGADGASSGAGGTGKTDSPHTSDASVQEAFIYIDVGGAVNAPGVVKVSEGARVFQAIEMAGGLREDADGRYVNQARVLGDGEQIYVPTREETASAADHPAEWTVPGNGGSGDGDLAGLPGNGLKSADADGKININTADADKLMTLNGIGEAKAEAIILYRETNGAFESIEDIMKVSGIKNALFNSIKDDITVG